MLIALLNASLAQAAGLATIDGSGLAAASVASGRGDSVSDDALVALAADFDRSAETWQVPRDLLVALAWEASHFDADAASLWGGYGLFDFREADAGPGVDIEDAAILLGCSPDDIIDDPALQVDAAAAVLARTARVGHDGHLPAATDLEAWWPAVVAMSGRAEPNLQHMYAQAIFSSLESGFSRGPLGVDPVTIDWADTPAVPPPPASRCDYSGCYQFVAASSSNYSDYSRTASDISYVIIHTVQGSYSGCISWFQDSSANVSAHYVVRSSDGQVTQMVAEEDVAWHAGNWDYNLASVGIEHEGYVDDPDTWYTDAMYAGSAALTADIIARNGIPASRSYIIGHYEVPHATHTDPGSGWDWDTYMALVTGGEVTGDIIGVVRDTDIYDGADLIGATVEIAETGETTTVGSDGYYHFYDEPLDTYTMWASMDGYEPGSCTKTISQGDNWCSIALIPSTGGGSDGGATDGGADSGTTGGDGGSAGDGGGTDGGATGSGDTGTTDGGDPGDDPPQPSGGQPGSPPGSAVPLDDVKGGCSQAPDGAALLPGLLGLLGLARRRRSADV